MSVDLQLHRETVVMLIIQQRNSSTYSLQYSTCEALVGTSYRCKIRAISFVPKGHGSIDCRLFVLLLLLSAVRTCLLYSYDTRFHTININSSTTTVVLLF